MNTASAIEWEERIGMKNPHAEQKTWEPPITAKTCLAA